MAHEIGVDGRVAPVAALVVRGDDFGEGDVHIHHLPTSAWSLWKHWMQQGAVRVMEAIR